MSVEDAPERRRAERRKANDNRFWRAMKGERRLAQRRRPPAEPEPPAPPPALPPPPPPTPDDERRETLRHMLRAAEARQARSGRRRRPVLAEGLRVAIVRGELAGRAGTILDADYIDSRVLLRVDDRDSPLWIPFSRLGPADDDAPA